MADRSIPRFPRNVLGTDVGEFNQVLNATAGIITTTIDITIKKVVNGLETIKGALTVNGNQVVTNDVNVTGSLILGVGALDAIPTGAMTAYAGASASIPSAWFLCDGSTYDTTVEADLFAVIGYTYGGAGANFNVPDCRGRVVIGPDNGAGLITTAPNLLGNTGGADSHVLTVTEMPTHSHSGTSNTDGSHMHSPFAVSGTAAATGAHTHPNFGIPASNPHTHTLVSYTSPMVISAAGAIQNTAPAVTLFSGASAIGSNFSTVTWNGSATGGTHQHNVSFTGTAGPDGIHTHPLLSSFVGTDAPHTNLMPHVVVNYIIKR